MSNNTAIQWTDVTDNILVVEGGGWWCRKISEGCANCYAAKLNQSDFFGGNKLPYSGKPPALVLRTDIIDGWKRQRKPKKHFVCSMTDIFGEWVDQEMANTFLDGMCVQGHVFQLLTKRPEIMRDRVNGWLKARGYHSPPRSIWGGVSVESAKHGYRIAELLRIPFAVRFVSLEPLLGPIRLDWLGDDGSGQWWHGINTLTGEIRGDHENPERSTWGPSLDWVIVGGESGPKARPCNVDWIRDIVQQCREAGAACFVKQIGSQAYQSGLENGGIGDGPIFTKHSKGGDPSEWPADLRVREFPKL